MNLHQEVHFEREICAHLAAHGWLHAEGETTHFDRATGQIDVRGRSQHPERAGELPTEEKVLPDGISDHNSRGLKIFPFPALD